MQDHHGKPGARKMVRTRHPGIYKREGCYVVVWKDRGRQHKSSHRTVAEALEAQGKRRQLDARAPVSRESFEDHARAWIDSYQGRTSRGFSETTRDAYRSLLTQHAIPFFRSKRIGDVRRSDARAFVVHLQRGGLAPTSVVKVLAPVKAMLATAVEDGVLVSDPTHRLIVNRRDEREQEHEAKAMTHKELAAVLRLVPDSWRTFFELLACTGLRISEALGLDWTDVEFGARPMLKVRRQFYRGKLSILKTRHSRRDLPLPPGLARKLWAARPAKGEGAMFAARTGTRYLDRNVRRVLDKATEDTPVAWVTFHTFRHTCASLLFESGKNIRQVATWLGHSDPAFTLRTYVHLLDAGLGEAEFLDGVMNGATLGATRGPKTAANAEPVDLPNTALESPKPDHAQTAATA